jgi:hypothetical protein
MRTSADASCLPTRFPSMSRRVAATFSVDPAKPGTSSRVNPEIMALVSPRSATSVSSSSTKSGADRPVEAWARNAISCRTRSNDFLICP